jgi:hypothetical protein
MMPNPVALVPSGESRMIIELSRFREMGTGRVRMSVVQNRFLEKWKPANVEEC